MSILNLLQTKTKHNILSIDDVIFDATDINKIYSTFSTKNKIEIALNKTLKEIIKNIENIPNYDSYLCHLIYLYEEFDLCCNISLIKNFIEKISSIERIGIPSYSYIWAIKYLVLDAPNNSIQYNFWQILSEIVNPKLKYLCQFALIKQNKISLDFNGIKKFLKENNSEIIFHDLKLLNVTNDEFIFNAIEKIKIEDSELWTKIKSETIKEETNNKKGG